MAKKKIKNGTCIIVGAADFDPSLLPERGEGDLLIAADGGYLHLENCGVKPDFFIGDTDSLGTAPKDLKSVILPCVKDDTDLGAAVKYALGEGWRNFILLGVFGGARPSHSLASLQTLLFLKRNGARGKICDARASFFLLEKECFQFPPSKEGFFSLFAVTPTAIVSEKGTKYELKKYRLKSSFPLGVSNEFCGKDAFITVHRGACLLVLEDK